MTRSVKQFVFVLIISGYFGFWFSRDFSINIWRVFKPSTTLEIEYWLKECQLEKYWELFRRKVSSHSLICKKIIIMWADKDEICSIGMAVQSSSQIYSEISKLSQCTQQTELPQLPPLDEQRLQKASQQLQQRLILRLWLSKLGLQHYYTKLLYLEVTSLEDVYWLEDNKAKQVFSKDFLRWSTARQSLPTSKQTLDGLKAELWSEVVKNSSHQDAWTWGGMLVVSVSIAGLVTLAAMTQPSLAPEAKHTLLQYVTGKYLLPSNCRVNFDWSSPQRVGQTVSFIVEFYQRNGQPYPICDTDNFTVEVCGGSKILTVMNELGSPTDPNCGNIARVKFTVRHAGQYRISVTVGAQHVAGSPFTAVFIAGPIFAQRTVVLRHCSTVVCTVNVTHSLFIEPRDEYNNFCRYSTTDDPTKGYSINIVQLGSSFQDYLEMDNEIYKSDIGYDWKSQRVTVQLLFFQQGCYHATFYYNDMLLNNGEFDIIVLNSGDSTLVQKNVASKNHNVSYDGKLLGINGERLLKPKKVLCYVSPKQLIIKELILKFIPKRLYTFRLCPSTKFNFQPEFLKCSEDCHNSFTIDDGCQPKIELVSKERNVIAATFAQFLLKNMGGSETFKDKQDFFFHEVRKFHQRHQHEKISLKVSRHKLLESSMKATKKFSVSDWCKNFEISFCGEQGIDWGGLRREWFELICAELFNPKNELFRSFHEGQQSLVHPNHQRPSHLKLKHYEFAGKVVGKCLYESALGGSYRQLVRARLTRSFLAQVIGLRVHYKYFEQDDPDLYLSKIKYLMENNIDLIDMELYFVEEQYDSSGQLVNTVELIRNGSNIKVTNSTKFLYLDALAQYRLATCIKDEMEAFLKGLNELIPDNLLSIFDENEVELLLCGTGQYNIADFKANHVVNGNSLEFRRVVGWFWAAVGNFTQEEMARLLQFTTGCSQLPPGGFKELSPKFQITAAPTFGNLPTAHTCFNQLCLPDYDCYEQFEKSLLLAISEGTEGFGMV